ncbi:hypothetical protein EON81_18610 [bacterium]|nr:MAG: hypothetical protein EON81_18610 [bacterium]
MDEVRRQRRMWWLNLIGDFGNLQRQRECWTDPERYDTYVTLTVSYRDDLGLSAENGGLEGELELGTISPAEFAITIRFHELVLAYEEPNGDFKDHATILADPHWQEVVRAAQMA